MLVGVAFARPRRVFRLGHGQNDQEKENQGRRFGRRVRELRKRANMTQEALGNAAGVNFKFVGGIERGEENPSLSIILKLATGLGVEPGELFELEHVQSERALRAQARTLLDETSPADIQRFVRIMRALSR